MAHVRSLVTSSIAFTLFVSVASVVIAGHAQRASASPLRRCEETQLDVNWTPDGAGLGHVADLIVFTNISANACSLSGYPAVRMSGSAKASALLVARDTLNGYLGGLARGTARSLPVVKLSAHGGVASSMVEGDDNPVGSALSCLEFSKVSVRIPHLSPPYRFTIKFPGCVRPQTHPIVKGPSGNSSA
ncbi:MAG: DUF4232 domain-containing protein [Acidimicrobiales bacterium]